MLQKQQQSMRRETGWKPSVHDAQEFAKQCERNNGKMSITFYPGINEFRGERQIQIVITHYR